MKIRKYLNLITYSEIVSFIRRIAMQKGACAVRFGFMALCFAPFTQLILTFVPTIR
jgi:hypothetical protein